MTDRHDPSSEDTRYLLTSNGIRIAVTAHPEGFIDLLRSDCERAGIELTEVDRSTWLDADVTETRTFSHPQVPTRGDGSRLPPHLRIDRS